MADSNTICRSCRTAFAEDKNARTELGTLKIGSSIENLENLAISQRGEESREKTDVVLASLLLMHDVSI